MLFWSKVFSKNYAQHLRNTLKGNYKVTTDWTGKRCLGITLDWDCKRRQVNLSMPKYGMKVWKQFQHNLKKIHHQSFPSAKIKCKDWIWSKEVAQLDCLPIAVTQKINLPTNYIRLRGRRPPLKTPQKDAFTGDLNFSIVTFCKIMFDISSNNGPVKKFKMYADESFGTIHDVVSDPLYLASIHGKLMFFIIDSQNCFVQNRKNRNFRAQGSTVGA